MEQNRDPRNKPKFLWSIKFDKGGMSIQWSKDRLFNKWCWENWTGTCKKNKTRPPTYTKHQNKLKMNKRLKYKYETIKILSENIGSKISDILRSNIFANISARAEEIKENINKWDYIKLKSFCVTKETIIKMKRELAIWEDIFANDISDKGLSSKIHKELI